MSRCLALAMITINRSDDDFGASVVSSPVNLRVNNLSNLIILSIAKIYNLTVEVETLELILHECAIIIEF